MDCDTSVQSKMSCGEETKRSTEILKSKENYISLEIINLL